MKGSTFQVSQAGGITLSPCLPEALMSTASFSLFLLQKRDIFPYPWKCVIYVLSDTWPVALPRSSEEQNHSSGSSQLLSTHLGVNSSAQRQNWALQNIGRAGTGCIGFPCP